MNNNREAQEIKGERLTPKGRLPKQTWMFPKKTLISILRPEKSPV